MGLFALGVLWLNALLVAAAALSTRARLVQIAEALRLARAAGELVSGRVVAVDGADALGTRKVAQLGRAMTIPGPDRILFTDREIGHDVAAATLSTHDGDLRIEASDRAEVWPAPDAIAVREDDFAKAWEAASTSKGHPSHASEKVGVPGELIWVRGRREGSALVPTLVSAMDPIAWCASARARLLAFAIGELALCGVVTAVAFVPPVFGVVSTLGGALSLAFFLGVQPMGVAERRRALTPARRPLGGLWQRP